MIAAILCGGYGLRLRPMVGERQKCAVPIAGLPWIHRVLEALHHDGIRWFLLLTGYRAEEIEAAARAWVQGKPDVTVVCQYSTPTGPDDAVEQAFAVTGADRLLVVNGDTVIDGFDLRDFLGAPHERTCVVRGPSALDGVVRAAGITLAMADDAETPDEWLTSCAYLDIGIPEGLAEARRRYSS